MDIPNNINPAQKPNLLAQRKNVNLMKSLFKKIQNDIRKAANSKNAKEELEFFTTVNLMKCKRYKEDVDAIIDSIDGHLKNNMR